MPRGPRLDFAGALHHVMARGIEKRDIFVKDSDRDNFLRRLGAVAAGTETAVYAWCLMPNHFHLLLRPGPRGLSAFMRSLQTGHACYFNRAHDRCGHLFQNRFKSILVEDEPYFLCLVRYIHVNPVRAGLVANLDGLDAYPWGGHAVLMGRQKADWMDTMSVLERFGRNPRRSRIAYREYISAGLHEGHRPEFTQGGPADRSTRPGIAGTSGRGREEWAANERVLGSEDFVDEVIRLVRDRKVRKSEIRGRAASLPELCRVICTAFGIGPAELTSGSKRRDVVEARSAFCAAALSSGATGSAAALVAGVRLPAVLRAVDRGRRALERRGIKAEELLV